jgi:hypothetical protein
VSEGKAPKYPSQIAAPERDQDLFAPDRQDAVTLDAALDYAAGGWEIFPLRGKVPAISGRTGGRGMLDATTNEQWLREHWRPGYNIGARVHSGLIVLDTDPRHGGEDNLTALASESGELPETLTCFSGRKDGGRHRYFLHPGGVLSSKRLPEGVDLKTRSGYVVVPPSRHPETGLPYYWEDPKVPIAPCPAWLADLLRQVSKEQPRHRFAPRVVHDAESVADWFTANTTWSEVLGPAGWTETGGGWRHPEATSTLSASIRHDLLFVYSTSTAFEVTQAEVPHGYTRFRAWAVLKFGGDLSAAAKAARAMRKDREVAA